MLVRLISRMLPQPGPDNSPCGSSKLIAGIYPGLVGWIETFGHIIEPHGDYRELVKRAETLMCRR